MEKLNNVPPVDSAERRSRRLTLPPYLEPIDPNSEREVKDWRLNRDRVFISGKGSTGNSSLANSLAREYRLPKTRIIHVGEKMRAGDEGIAPLERTIEQHRMLDYGTILDILGAPHLDRRPAIVDAKLGGVFNHYVKLVAEDHDLVKLIRELDKQHVFDYYPDYAFLRELRENDIELPDTFAVVNWARQVKRMEIAMNKDALKGTNENAVRRMSLRRDRTDLETWNEAHVFLRDWHNILERDATDKDGRLIYDRFIDSSKLTADQATQAAHGIFVQEGVVVDRKRTPIIELFPDKPVYLDPGEEI